MFVELQRILKSDVVLAVSADFPLDSMSASQGLELKAGCRGSTCFRPCSQCCGINLPQLVLMSSPRSVQRSVYAISTSSLPIRSTRQAPSSFGVCEAPTRLRRLRALAIEDRPHVEAQTPLATDDTARHECDVYHACDCRSWTLTLQLQISSTASSLESTGSAVLAPSNTFRIASAASTSPSLT